MPREVRIEYEGAVYHALARGNRREPIVLDDTDCQRFEETLREVIESSGWRLYAWTLMENHYHLLFETPEPNLVKGMTWFQNTWTRRFNARHQLWGHLYGGRYKAIPVEEGDYLTTLIDYIHLNPVRARMVDKSDGIESYQWSSLIDYVKPLRTRREWVAACDGLEHLGFPDTPTGRQRFLEATEGRIDWTDPDSAGAMVMEGQSLQSTLRRGWYFGSESFRERLLEKLEKTKPGGEIKDRRRRGHTGSQARDHGEAEARRIIGLAADLFALEYGDWKEMKKGDWRKGLVAGLIRRRSLVDNGWLADHLHMGARNAVSRTIRISREYIETNRNARKKARELERMSDSID